MQDEPKESFCIRKWGIANTHTHTPHDEGISKGYMEGSQLKEFSMAKTGTIWATK